MNSASQQFNAYDDCLLVVYCGIPRESVLKASLGNGLVNSREFGVIL